MNQKDDRQQTGTAIALAQACLHEAGLTFAREDSVKFLPDQFLTERTMLGVHASAMDDATIERICARLAMPAGLRRLMRDHVAPASVVLIGVEDSPDACTYKLYLEFWDSVRDQVQRTGSRDPLLLHLGFKWQVGAQSGRTSRYVCYPMLGHRECLARLRALFVNADAPADAPADVPPGASPGAALAIDLIARCRARRPGAAFVYLEADEEGTPRRSFDVNLYKAGLRLADVGDWLNACAQHFGAPAGAIDVLLGHAGSCLLGHLSGGRDRAGREFLTIYYEREPLPAPPGQRRTAKR